MRTVMLTIPIRIQLGRGRGRMEAIMEAMCSRVITILIHIIRYRRLGIILGSGDSKGKGKLGRNDCS